MDDVVKALEEKVKILENENEEFEHNYRTAIGSHGRIGKELKSLRKDLTKVTQRIDDLEAMMANKHKKVNKEVE